MINYFPPFFPVYIRLLNSVVVFLPTTSNIPMLFFRLDGTISLPISIVPLSAINSYTYLSLVFMRPVNVTSVRDSFSNRHSYNFIYSVWQTTFLAFFFLCLMCKTFSRIYRLHCVFNHCDRPLPYLPFHLFLTYLSPYFSIVACSFSGPPVSNVY